VRTGQPNSGDCSYSMILVTDARQLHIRWPLCLIVEACHQSSSILVEILRHEALPSKQFCPNCQESSSPYRCRDCFRTHMWCRECCVSTHMCAPFHHIQMWNGNHFEQSDLLTQELIIDLVHYPDDCPSIPSNEETQMMNNPDDLDDADEFQPLQPSGSTIHSGS
jgi:hypothetical protein